MGFQFLNRPPATLFDPPTFCRIHPVLSFLKNSPPVQDHALSPVPISIKQFLKITYSSITWQ
jgi:hypothetical protein